mgnify:CR=1 FL=1
MRAIVKGFADWTNVATAITNLNLRRFPMRYSMMLLVLSAIVLTAQQSSAKPKQISIYGCTAAQLATPAAVKCLDDGVKFDTSSFNVCSSDGAAKCCWYADGQNVACYDEMKDPTGSMVPRRSTNYPLTIAPSAPVSPGGVRPLPGQPPVAK